MTQAIQLIVGLGNPGIEYANTRHNAGAWWVEDLLQQFGASWKSEPKFQARVALIPSQPIRLLIPTTFMNHSGRAVAAVAHFYKILPNEILIAYDELDLEPGITRLKVGGGHGGHNGVRDIISALGSPEFLRARIGIGHPGDRSIVSNYVLGRPSVQDNDKIKQAMANLSAVLPHVLAGEFNVAMKTLHTAP